MSALLTPTSKLAILISGRGSNMVSILSAMSNGTLSLALDNVIVISSSPHADGIQKAEQFGVETLVLDYNSFPSRARFEDKLLEVLHERNIDFIVLAGFMLFLSEKIVGNYETRIMNIHPSLLPSFPGLHAQKQALEYGVAISGCTTHLVTTDLDMGPILGQKCVRVLSTDSEEQLSARILEQEHQLIVETLSDLLTKKLRLEGRRVIWSE